MTYEKNEFLLSSDQLLDRYRALVNQHGITIPLKPDVESELATKLSTVIAAELERSTPRETWLEVTSALMLMQARVITLTKQTVESFEREQIAMSYSNHALKREGFMVGGWVLFICGVVAYLGGWL